MLDITVQKPIKITLKSTTLGGYTLEIKNICLWNKF